MKATAWIWVFGIIFSAVLAAQTPQVQPATVEGVVKNLKTGEPLADVRVALTPETSGLTAKSATTDSEGRFSITAVPPGRYAVAATRTLYFRPRRNSGASTLTLSADQRLRDLQLQLMPTGVISGRVLDDNREPIRSVRVEALRNEYREGARIWVSAGQNTTDDRGEYRLFNLQPGTYYVRATQGVGTTQLGPAYFPAVLDPQDAAPIQIAAGDEIGGIDLSLRRGSEFFVQLKLGGMTQGSTATFFVQRRDSKINEQLPPRTENLPDNTYRIPRLNPGTYDIFVQVATPATVQPRAVTHTAKIPFNITSDNVDLGTVSVRPSVPVTGRVVAAEQLPSAVDPRRLVITLRPLDLPPTFAASARSGTSPSTIADDGTFTLPTVAIGRFQISVTGLPADTYLVSVRNGSREVFDSGLTVTGDQGPVDLLIGGPGSVGTVEGNVVNVRGEAVPFSPVALVPNADRRANLAAFRTATTDQFGAFIIRAVLPGDYKIFAWEDIEPGAYLNQDFLKDFETRGEAIQVQRGSQNVVSARVIPAPN